MLDAAALFDPASAAIVLGGTVLVALLRASPRRLRADLATAFARARLVEAAASLARLEQAIGRAGTFAVDPAIAGDADLDAAARRLCRTAPRDELVALFAAQRAARARATERAAALFTDAAETAPTLGLIGTVIGLMALFAGGGAGALAGGGLSTALLTTLYGAVLGTVVLAPIASRLTARARDEDEVRATLEARLLALADPRGRPILHAVA